MRNDDIAAAFEELADRLALTDMKPYRYMAYRRAAETFRNLADSVAVLSEEGKLLEIDGVGKAIDDKVRDLLATGTFKALEEARAEVSDTLLALVSLPGIGPATARKVYAELDGEGFESLLDRARMGTLEPRGAMTKKVVDALTAEAAKVDAGAEGTLGAEFSGVPRAEDGAPLPGPWFRRDQALELASSTRDLVAASLADVELTGAYARGCELVNDVRLIATAEDPEGALDTARDHLASRGWETSGEPRIALPETDGLPSVAVTSVIAPSGATVLLAAAAPSVRAEAELQLAGPYGWSGSRTVPVELRDRVMNGELAEGNIPADLITAADIRGELHAHSDWSDGKATILDMARAARARGDEYFAVTDHSAPYAMVGGLDPDRIRAQADEIARANEQLQREHEQDGEPPMRVLRGTELEILPDGTLGLPDATLATLDWVVASLHVQQGQSAEKVRARMQPVLENPLVDAIGHPTSRRMLKRERTALDVTWLIEQSKQHDVVLEINANPDRLDLDSAHAAEAIAAGVRLTINTDAHRTRTLALREHGVAVARRAGVPASMVVNCLPPDQLLAGRRRER